MPSRRDGSTATPRKRWIRGIKRALIVLVCLFSVLVMVVFGVYSSAIKDARVAVEDLQDRLDKYNALPTVFVSADGKELFRKSPEFRIPIKLAELKDHVWKAMLAAEDKRFLEHGGYDSMGLARAVVSQAMHKKSGGSTITMQLAKQLYNGSSQTMSRKVKDIAVATAIEEAKTKSQILEMYLNIVYFGERAYGISAAAKTYFNKSPNDLTIREAAMLARCVRLPAKRNPVVDYDISIDESNYVLQTMLEEKWITQEQYDQAFAERPKISKRQNRPDSSGIMAAHYAVAHAQSELEKYYPDVPWQNGGYKIELTIDLDLQRKTEQAVREVVDAYRHDAVNAGAFVLGDKDGRILAEVGGMDYSKEQFNIVTQGRLQPGSSFKAIVYSAAMEAGIVHLRDVLPNTEFHLDMHGSRPWNPHNSSARESSNSVSIETAFAGSWNLPAAWTLFALGAGGYPEARASIGDRNESYLVAMAGATKVAKFAKDVFAIDVPKGQVVPAIALGVAQVSPLQMMRAYSTFMLHGSRFEPRIIARITGPDGSVLHQFEPDVHHVLDETVVSQMDELMARVVTSGTGTDAGVVPNARGKTGTTNDHKDAWFCGYTDGLVGVGWVGNLGRIGGKPSQRAMRTGVFGGTVTAKIWAKVMLAARQKYAVVIQAPPPDKTPTDKEKPTTPSDDTPTPNDPDNVPAEEPNGAVKVSPPDDGDSTKPPKNGPPDEPTVPVVKDPPSTEPPPAKTPSAKESTKRETDSEVQVEVCADSGMVASRYCPETVTRGYKKGKEPKRLCTLHKANGGGQ